MGYCAKKAGLLVAAAASVCAFHVEAQGAEPAAPAGDNPFATTPAPEGRPLRRNVDIQGNVIKNFDFSEQPIGDFLQLIKVPLGKNIVASKDVRGTVSVSMSNVTPMEILDAVLHMNGFAYREKGNIIYVYTAKELEAVERSERKMNTEVFRLNYVPANVALDMIAPALSADAPKPAIYKDKEFQISGDAETLEYSSFSAADMVIVTDYPEVMDKVKTIIRELDKRPQQVLVEATILQAQLNDNNSMGVDFTLLGGVDFRSLSAAGATPVDALSGEIINNPALGDQLDNGVRGAGTNFPGGNSGVGLNVGIMKNNVGVFVNALEAITNTVVLANPKVLTLNKQPGVVIVGRKDGYYTTTVTQTSTVQSVEMLETGTRLLFKPHISDDGYIRLIIHPEDSTGGVNQVNLPFKQTTEVTTNVLVKDGHTIVIGGLFRENNRSRRSQVPFLGDLPLAGYLFRQQADETERTEVIVLLTPHIIKSDSAYANASDVELRKADQLLIGSRKGMMPFSRTRLSEMAYDKARAEMQQKYPDRDRAMWYLDCATSLSPIFTEAILMKEAIASKDIASAEQSSIRYFVRRQVLDEVGAAAPAPRTAVVGEGAAVAAPAAPAEPVAPAAKAPAAVEVNTK
jgi:type IV pilus assembly protein PilQ